MHLKVAAVYYRLAAAKDKIIEIDIVTNYRVFQYNYDSHTGTAILLLSIAQGIQLENCELENCVNNMDILHFY